MADGRIDRWHEWSPHSLSWWLQLKIHPQTYLMNYFISFYIIEVFWLVNIRISMYNGSHWEKIRLTISVTKERKSWEVKRNNRYRTILLSYYTLSEHSLEKFRIKIKAKCKWVKKWQLRMNIWISLWNIFTGSQ